MTRGFIRDRKGKDGQRGHVTTDWGNAPKSQRMLGLPQLEEAKGSSPRAFGENGAWPRLDSGCLAPDCGETDLPGPSTQFAVIIVASWV